MKRWSLKKREAVTAWIFLTPSLILFATFVIYPMIVSFYYSLCQYSGYSPPEFIGLDNFRHIFQDRVFLIAIGNSFLYLLVTPALIILSILMAMMVNNALKGINFFRTAYYLPVVTPVVVVAIIWRQMMNEDYGLINQVLQNIGLIQNNIPFLTGGRTSLFWIMSVTVWRGLGYFMVIFLAGLKGIPFHLRESARIDGVSKFQEFRYITIPMLMPSITLAIVLSSISALRVFEEVFMMVGERGGVNYSLTTAVLRIYEVGFVMMNPRLGEASAMAVVLFSAILIFSIFNLRFLSKWGYHGEV